MWLALLTTRPLFAQDQPSSPSDGPAPAPQLEQIVVTGTRVETRNLDVPASITVIGEDRLERPGVKSAPEALNDVSGVKLNPRQENSLFSDMEVRGLAGNATSGNNVLILLDGVPQRRLSFGGPYLGALPYEAINRMELVKGAEASLYGRNAMAGALQLFSDPGSFEQHYAVNSSFEWPTEDVRTSIKAAGPLGKGTPENPPLGTYSVTGSFNYADGWQPGTDRLRGDIYFHTVFHISDTDRLSVFGGFVDGTENVVSPVFVDKDGHRLPGFDRDTNIAVKDHNSIELQEGRFGTTWSHDWNEDLESKITVAYWHGDTRWDVGRPDDQPKNGSIVARPTDERRFLEDSIYTEAEIIGRYEATDWWKGEAIVGASFDRMTYDMTQQLITTRNLLQSTGKYSSGIPFDLSTMQTADTSPWVFAPETERDTTENNAGVFVRKQFEFLDRIYLMGGARYDWFERTQLNPATDEEARLSDGAFSPSVGLAVALLKTREHKVSVYGNYGLGFSPMYRAVNNTVFADVKPETSVSTEAGIKSSFWKGWVEASLAVYQLDRRDIVAMNPDTKLQENVGDWRITGIESDWRVRLTKELSVFSSIAWRDPEIVRYEANRKLEGNWVPAVSDQIITGGLEGRWRSGWGGGMVARYASAFFGNESNSFKLPERTVCDAWVSYDFSRNVRVSLFVKNFLNEEYYTAVFNGTSIGAAFEGTPRTVGVSLACHF